MFQGRIDEAFGAEFVYEIHAKELVVGEIFVRIYNEQPTFPLDVRHFKILFFLSLLTLIELLDHSNSGPDLEASK